MKTLLSLCYWERTYITGAVGTFWIWYIRIEVFWENFAEEDYGSHPTQRTIFRKKFVDQRLGELRLEQTMVVTHTGHFQDEDL